MKKYRALVTFTGDITKSKGEIFSLDIKQAFPLIKARFIEEVKEKPLEKVEIEVEDKWDNNRLFNRIL